MSSSAKARDVFAESVSFSEDSMIVTLDDGRTISVPMAWYPRLLHGTKPERERYELLGDGEGIPWLENDRPRATRPYHAGWSSGADLSSIAR
jgi:hypothetical protein